MHSIGSGERRWGVFALGLSLLCSKPLWDWFQYSLKHDEASYVILIPLISAYLVWEKRKELPKAQSGLSWVGVVFLLGGATGMGLWLSGFGGDLLEGSTHGTVMFCVGYVSLLLGGAFLFLGWPVMRMLLFPAVFLYLMTPMPTVVMLQFSHGLQVVSAEVAHGMFVLSGMTISKDGQYLYLPGIRPLLVAEECSGIRSTTVLLVTSILAAHLLLRTGWRRAVLILVVLPLGVLRNGFRILVVGSLCVYVDPDMIHSWIHKQGGPVFFVLSLVPLFLLLWWLRRSESRSVEGAGVGNRGVNK